MDKKKFIFYMDGDNNYNQTPIGIEKLDEEDEVHVYFCATNAHYRSEKQQTKLRNKTKAKVEFIMVETIKNATDFCIAVDLSAKMAVNELADDTIYFIVSMDSDFNSILNAILARYKCGMWVNRVTSVEEAYAKYFVFKASSPEDFFDIIQKQYGKELHGQIRGRLATIYDELETRKQQAARLAEERKAKEEQKKAESAAYFKELASRAAEKNKLVANDNDIKTKREKRNKQWLIKALRLRKAV